MKTEKGALCFLTKRALMMGGNKTTIWMVTFSFDTFLSVKENGKAMVAIRW